MREMVCPPHRAISVDGLVNARDLGGLRRADGSTAECSLMVTLIAAE
jgi:hypothetical protein